MLGNGTIQCWGQGALGDGSYYSDGTEPPVTVSGITNAVQVAAGLYTTCAVLATGKVRCWGDNSNGQLGDGLAPSGHGPQPVPHTVIGFGGNPPTPDDPGNGNGNGGGTAETPTTTTTLPAPPVVLPPRPVTTRAWTLRLVGRTLKFRNYVVKKQGLRCPTRVRVLVRVQGVHKPKTRSIAVRKAGRKCTISSSIRLATRARKLKTVTVKVSARTINVRITKARR